LSKLRWRTLEQWTPERGHDLRLPDDEETDVQLAQRVAVVTGAAGGLGAAISRGFAREGAKVVLCDINEAAVRALADEITATGAEGLAPRCSGWSRKATAGSSTSPASPAYQP
jgi:shikimate 5-dehydrogenase